MKKPKRKPCQPLTYTLMSVILASPTRPMPEAKRLHQLTRMWQGLASIECGPAPTTDDWRVCSDAVNLLETLVVAGEVGDEGGEIMRGITALAMAGKRQLAGKAIRLDGPGIMTMRGLLEGYAMALENLSERVMVKAHRDTEIRIRAIFEGKRRPHDVEVTSI